MIDTHSHIFATEFDDDLKATIERAKNAGITAILMPNIDSTTIEALYKTESAYSGYCYSMMGVHPTSINADNYLKELAVVEKELFSRQFVAVGEIGIDLYWDKSYLKEQIEVFETQLKWAKELRLPVAIHCREAFPYVYDSVKKFSDGRLSGVFHSFGGTAEEASLIMALDNFYVGINGVVTFKRSTLPETLISVPLEKVLLETDAPYLAPVPFRGKRNEPSYVVNTATKLSEIYGLSLAELIAITNANSLDLFSKISEKTIDLD